MLKRSLPRHCSSVPGGVRLTVCDVDTLVRDRVVRSARLLRGQAHQHPGGSFVPTMAATGDSLYADAAAVCATTHASEFEAGARAALRSVLPHSVRRLHKSRAVLPSMAPSPSPSPSRGSDAEQQRTTVHAMSVTPGEAVGLTDAELEARLAANPAARRLFEVVFGSGSSSCTPLRDLKSIAAREVVLPFVHHEDDFGGCDSDEASSRHPRSSAPLAVSTKWLRLHTGWYLLTPLLTDAMSLQNELLVTGEAVAVKPGLVVSALPRVWARALDEEEKKKACDIDESGTVPLWPLVVGDTARAPARMQPSLADMILPKRSPFRVELASKFGWTLGDDQRSFMRCV